ncbi:hypothetical protein RZ737_004895 [Escherichia coli]|nr:hypothetical protein [Escherichia coli]
MSKLAEFKALEAQLAAQLKQLNELKNDDGLKREIEFEEKLRELMAEYGRRQKLSATPDLSGTVLPLCLIPNSALKNAPPFKSAVPKGSACARLLA